MTRTYNLSDKTMLKAKNTASYKVININCTQHIHIQKKIKEQLIHQNKGNDDKNK